MSIQEKLNTMWAQGKTTDVVFEFRAITETMHQMLSEAIEKIDELSSSTSFQVVDSELKQEGSAIRKILSDAKMALDQHQEFLNWNQPEN